jgi:hypothetical protein
MPTDLEKNALDEAILTLVASLKESGLTELDDVCRVIGETLEIDAGIIKESLTANPFVGEEPSFEDIITDAILGALPSMSAPRTANKNSDPILSHQTLSPQKSTKKSTEDE